MLVVNRINSFRKPGWYNNAAERYAFFTSYKNKCQRIKGNEFNFHPVPDLLRIESTEL